MLALYGELGSGKTAFTRGLCRGLGCRADVHSPTFGLIHYYPGDIEVAHIDLYRIDSGIGRLGWEDIIDSGRIIIIEWAEKARNDLPSRRFDIYFSIINSDSREIRVTEIDDSGNRHFGA